MKVTGIVGESPEVKVRFNRVQLACLIDTRSQVIIIAKTAFEAYFPATLCENNAIWESLKATNNSHIKTLGVIQVDVEVWR